MSTDSGIAVGSNMQEILERTVRTACAVAGPVGLGHPATTRALAGGAAAGCGA